MSRYRLARTIRRQWSSYLTIVLLVGAIGGVALGAAAAARRTQSAFPTFLKSTNPSDLLLVPAPPNPQDNFSAALEPRLARLPAVRHVESAIFINPYPVEPDGAPNLTALAGATSISTVGSIDGLYFTQDSPAVIAGRMADPTRPNEIVMTTDAARRLRVRVGSVVPFGFYTVSQQSEKGFGTPRVRPALTLDARVVGLVVLSTSVIQDDIDRTSGILFTPALTKLVLSPALASDQGWTEYGFQLNHGGADVRRVENEIARILAAGTIVLYHETAAVETQARHAIAPQVIALATFALIAALALVLVAMQAISRFLQLGREDRDVLRALGAGPAEIAFDASAGVMGSVCAGAILAFGVAVAVSPLSPIGPVRPVYPHRGAAVDWTVLAPGMAGIVLLLGVATLVLALRGAPHRRAAAARYSRSRPSATARLVASAGLPVSAVEGVRFALSSGRGRSAVPVRSVVSGAVLAVVILVTTLTFGASLTTLVTHPSLYGWNYTFALNSTFGIGSTPPRTSALLRADPNVAAFTPVVFYNLEFDGQTVPTMFEASNAPIAPPQLSGHPVRKIGQVVLGPATLAALHKRLGDVVVGTYTGGHRITFHIVGTATFPTIGLGSTLHPSLGVGAVASNAILGPGLNEGPVCGPQTQLLLIRLRPHVSTDVGVADGRRIAAATNRIFAHVPVSATCNGNGVELLGVQRPAEIVNYRTMGSTAALMGGVLALAALSALATTLVASVRRRRRELAIFKALGLRQRQLAATVAWQASVTMGVGVIVGVPVGVILGRWLWTLFARTIFVVPEPTVPWLPIVIVGLAAMVFANVAAALPGRVAAATPTALVLRSE